MQQLTKPYFLVSTDYNFYFKTIGSTFPKKQYLRINRLTSKCDSLSQSKFKQQTYQISSKFCQEVFLIIGIINVLEQPYLCLVNSVHPTGTFMNDQIYQIKNIKFIPFKHQFLYNSMDQSDCQKILQGIRNQIINDKCYYCYREDITLNYDKKTMNSKLTTQRKYFWNEDLLRIFVRHKLAICWQIPIMQGFISQIHCKSGHIVFNYLNISRRSKYMSGTRFNSRGIDTELNVANFVQTEEIVTCNNLLFSHISLRGSIPIFWEQPGFRSPIRFNQKQQQNQSIIKKYYDALKDEYNADIVTLNLLSSTKSPEKQLKTNFEFYYHKAIKGTYLFYDLNQQIKGQHNANLFVESFIKKHEDALVGKNNFFCLQRNQHKITSRQKTVPRINCMDCLDRTNVVMARISQLYLQQVCKFINTNANSPQDKFTLPKQFNQSFLTLWTQLGNQISIIYSGTGSVASYLTKKQSQTFLKFLSASIKSINRYYHANINDSIKQSYINYFLCKSQDNSTNTNLYFQDNLVNSILKENQYCTHQQFGIYITTWNCNMVQPDQLESRDAQKLFCFSREDVDIVVVCLQQMVELSSFNVILGNNQQKIQAWKTVLWQHINSHDERILHGKPCKSKRFDFLTSHDLVGISTFLFINTKLMDRINDIQWFEIKTGFKGSLGNKGVIILFMTIDNSPVTIMNCHLASGETKSNQRLQDIEYIHQQAIKQRKLRRYFDLSQFRFFTGDFNFRLDIKNQTVREQLYLIQKQDSQQKLNRTQRTTLLQSLLSKDQFTLNRNLGPLSSYLQQQIIFLPTYKYIKKQKRYDPKRTPSWCDRILFYHKDKKKFKSLRYFDVDIYLSDHKPVCATFCIVCKKENVKEKNMLIQKYYQS